MARWKKRPVANHRLRADDCRRHPRVWIEIGTYGSRYSAIATARHIRIGEHIPCYFPAGAYETRTTPANDGTTTLYARYIGETP